MANFITMTSENGTDEFTCSGVNHIITFPGQARRRLEFGKLFFDLPTSDWLCKNSLYDPQDTKGSVTLMALGVSVLHAAQDKTVCSDLWDLSRSEKLTTAANYAVSTQTPPCLPRAHILTGVTAFVVLRLPGLQILSSVWVIPSAKRVMRISEERGGVSGGVCAYG